MQISLTNGVDRIDFTLPLELKADPDECNTAAVRLEIGNLRYRCEEEFLTPALEEFCADAKLPRAKPLQLRGIGFTLTIARQDNTGHYQVKAELNNSINQIMLTAGFLVSTPDFERFMAEIKAFYKIKKE